MIDRFFEQHIASHQWLMSKPCAALRDEMLERGERWRVRQARFRATIALMSGASDVRPEA